MIRCNALWSSLSIHMQLMSYTSDAHSSTPDGSSPSVGSSDPLPNFSNVWSHPDLATHTRNDDRTANSNIVDSVYEVCFEVANVEKSLKQAVACGAVVVRPLTVAKSEQGIVTYATVQSCVGNVQHTILNSDQFSGRFLPGFEDSTDYSSASDHDDLGHLSFDHITFCVPPGKTFETIAWYADCFSMHRLIVNK